MNDICANKHGGNPESAAAHASIVGLKEDLYRRILSHLQQTGGSTADEVVQALGLLQQTVSPRLAELVALKRAYKSDLRRLTRSGRPARVICAALKK